MGSGRDAVRSDDVAVLVRSDLGAAVGGGGGRGGGGGAPTVPAMLSDRTVPLAFSGADSHAMYYGGGMVWKTINGGHRLDGDQPELLAEELGDPPKSSGRYPLMRDAAASMAAAARLCDRALRPASIRCVCGWAPTTE